MSATDTRRRKRKKRELRRRYIKLRDEYNRILDSYSCGSNLAEHVNPRLSGIKGELADVQREAERLRKEEHDE